MLIATDMEEKERCKDIHPRKRANILSHMFFCWELSVFVKGYKKELTENDLYGPLKDHQSRILGDRMEDAWNLEIRRDKPSLWRALRRVFGLEFFIYGLMLIPIELVFRLFQPLLIGKLMNYYSPDQKDISKNDAYLYASLIVVMSFFYVLFGHSYALGVQHLGMKIRVACSALIYRKSLKLSHKAFAETTVGQMVNLLSNDLNKFDYSVTNTHFLWMGPLETLIILYFLYTMLGPTAVVGIAILLTFIPVQIFFAKKISAYRMRTALKTDQRIRLMSEIISGIKVIKMYTWEKPFSKLVEKARKLEVQQIKSGSYIRATNMSCSIILSRAAIFSCILTYVLTGHTLEPEYIYVLSSFYEIIRLGSVIFLPLSMMFLGETITSVQRIQKFLLSPEVPKDNGDDNHQGITLEQVSTRWDSSADNVLNNISLTVKPKQLVAVIGPVGSGKSTLLQVLLREIEPVKGRIQIGNSVAYASQDSWLFGGSIRENILFGESFDKDKYNKIIEICVLEQDFSSFPYGDRTLVGEKGVMLSGGQKARINLARAVYKDANFYLLDDPLSAVDTQVGNHLFRNCIQNYLNDKTRILVTHQLQYLKGVDMIYLIENGQITASGTYRELRESDNTFLKLLEEHERNEKNEDSSSKIVENNKENDEPSEVKETQKSGTVSNRVYRNYFSAGGSFIIGAIVIFLHIIVQLVANGTDYFISFWVNLEEGGWGSNALSSNDCLYIYIGLIVFLIFITLICIIQFFLFCLKASTKLHNRMFHKIVHMSMRFFNTNPSGRILNRFSQDIGLIDESLPITMNDTIEIALNIIGILVIIAVINPWILIPTLIMFITFYFYRKIYLATSRNLKRIEGRTRSPIFSHVSTSIQGLATIRAASAQNNLNNEFDRHQDLHSSSYYLYLACDCAFGFWLDLFCVIYLGFVTLSFLFIGEEKYGANVGLSITQSIMMTGLLQYGMKQWASLENHMTSVERVVEYTELQPEADANKDKKPPTVWPKDGKIEFKSVSLRYAPDDPFVLEDVSFVVLPREKIGIVGRTGAGKSSLVSVFFRLAQIEGEVLIDGVNTQNMSLQSLRAKISIIPQDPVLFSGTIRSNVDPFDEYQDEQLWNALEDVELKSAISELPGGLSSKVSEGGSNFSVGQRQLLCLARAIVRMNKILILDEATASVDLQTDELIQNTIRAKFRDCTVLTIAHRIHTIMDCDRILVIDAGKIVEFDKPSTLLENTEGFFYQLSQHSAQRVL